MRCVRLLALAAGGSAVAALCAPVAGAGALPREAGTMTIDGVRRWAPTADSDPSLLVGPVRDPDAELGALLPTVGEAEAVEAQWPRFVPDPSVGDVSFSIGPTRWTVLHVLARPEFAPLSEGPMSLDVVSSEGGRLGVASFDIPALRLLAAAEATRARAGRVVLEVVMAHAGALGVARLEFAAEDWPRDPVTGGAMLLRWDAPADAARMTLGADRAPGVELPAYTPLPSDGMVLTRALGRQERGISLAGLRLDVASSVASVEAAGGAGGPGGRHRMGLDGSINLFVRLPDSGPEGKSYPVRLEFTPASDAAVASGSD